MRPDPDDQPAEEQMYKATMTMHMVMTTNRSIDEVKFLLNYWQLSDFQRVIDDGYMLASFRCDNIELVPEERVQIEMLKAGYDPEFDDHI